jgi:hypothetical protein
MTRDEIEPVAETGGRGVLERHAPLATLALLGLLALVVFRDFLFGDALYLFRDIGHDTINLFYPRWVHIADYLRSDGLPGWSFSQGLGQDIRPFALGDPFTWILYACGASNIASALVFVEATKLVAAGMLFFAYLRLIGCRPLTAAIGSVLYAFSAFMLVAGSWYVFSSRGVAFALLLLAFESHLLRRRWWLFPLAVALVAASNPTTLLPFAVILAPYALARFFEVNGWQPRAAARCFGELLLLGILGLLGSAWFSSSILLNIAASPRATETWTASGRMLDVGLFELEFASHYYTAIASAFGSDLLGVGNDYTGWYNYLEAPLFYCGLATLPLFAASFCVLERRQRRLYGAFACFAILPVLLPSLRIALWGFSGNYYRELSLLVVLALLHPALRTLDALVRGARPRPGAIGLSLGVWLALLLGAVALSDSVEFDRALVGIVAALLLGYGALAALSLSRLPQRRRLVGGALLVLICLEAAGFAGHSLARRGVMHKSEWSRKVGYNDHSVEALAFIRARDPGFHRVVKDFGSSPATSNSRNDAKVQGYFGTMSYYSFNQIHYIRFLAAFGFIDGNDEHQTRWAKGMLGVLPIQGLMGVKYHLFRLPPDEAAQQGLQLLGRFGEFALYENAYFVPLGFVVEHWTPAGNLPRLGELTKRASLSLAAFLDDPPPPELAGAVEPIAAETLVKLVAELDMASVRERAQVLRSRALRLDSFSHNELRGRIEAQRAGVLVFAIPFDRGWQAELNGETARLERVDVGLTGLLLPAGEHTLVLRYVPPYGRAAAVTSLAALAVFALLLLRRRPAS